MKSLVGQGKPFHSAVDKTAALLKRKVGTGAEFMKELMGVTGIKPTELQERGLTEIMGMPRMTHDQFMAALNAKPAPAIKEKVLGGDRSEPDSEAPYHGKWTLPGGENYREMLIKAPEQPNYMEQIDSAHNELRNMPYHGRTPAQEERVGQLAKLMREIEAKAKELPEQFPGVGAHFGGEPGILASMRLKDRKGPNGEKLLHLEELQSDWHQQGREKGYGSQLTPEDKAKIANFEARQRHQANPVGEPLTIADRAEWAGLINKREGAVPDAPFKKNWEEMALKRLIHHAAEKGYHGVVVTPGAEQADRYSLAQHVDEISHYPRTDARTGEKSKSVRIDMKTGNPVQLGVNQEGIVDNVSNSEHENFKGKHISDIVGKEHAKNIMGDERGQISGEGLTVGGEGMKGFYDKKVPNILNSIGKKYGVKTQMGGHRLKGSLEDYGNAVEKLGIAHIPMAQLTPEQNQKIAETADKRLHHFPITEDMRKDVLTNGLPLYAEGGIIHKAEGGSMDTPDLAQSRLRLNQRANPALMDNIGIDEALDMSPKTFINPEPKMGGALPVGGVEKIGGLPIGGVDQSPTPGMQFGLQAPQQPQQSAGAPQGGLPDMGQPPASAPAPQSPTNILSLTPQGRALGAIAPQRMAKGGQPKSDAPYEETDKPKRVLFRGEGYGHTTGIVVPRHMWEGNKGTGNKKIAGMGEINEARAKVYGSENRDPLHIGQVGTIHRKVLKEHFAKPLNEQLEAEKNALAKLKEAKHIGQSGDTLDKSEKLDTVNHEYDDKGRSYKGFASKGVAGSSLYTSGHGENRKFHIINTCPGQTTGCGGGHDEKGIVDTMRGTCFAPNAESQYAAASVRRAAHEQAKHDPAMTSDWILSHTGSLRNAAKVADKQNKRLLFRPNVVDETDVSSRHVLRHLNEQRKGEGLPPITANSYGKTNELNDPENGYYVTHSNIGPKVKMGQSIQENIGKDKQRVRNTIMAADAGGKDFTNEQGNKTPPKGSYMVTDVKRGSQLGKDMAKHLTHAKYWTIGRSQNELDKHEKEEPKQAHYGPKGDLTTEDKAHYGHTTLNGKRYDYQKQNILHPRLVQVGHNDDGTPHMIPTDSRFKDEDFLPKNRYMTKNGKQAGHILMTTPTESTSTLGAQTSFTHHVGPEHLEHAKKNKGEYEIDSPMAQEAAADKEYVAPQPIQILKKPKKFALGGVVVENNDDHLNDDDFYAFPERNFAAQHHLAKRRGVQDIHELHPFQLYQHEAE